MMVNLASMYLLKSRWMEAKDHLTYRQIRSVLSEHPVDYLPSLSRGNLAAIYSKLELWDDAILFQEIVVQEEFEPETLISTMSLAGMYHLSGRRTDAAVFMETLAEAIRFLFGPWHPKTLEDISRLAVIYTELCQWGKLPHYSRRFWR